MSTAKVFVTQEKRGFDYSLAMHFGEVEFLSVDEFQPEPTSGIGNRDIRRRMERKLADYIPGTDFILTGGSPISIIITGIVMGQNPDSVHNVLKWDNRQRDYVLTKV